MLRRIVLFKLCIFLHRLVRALANRILDKRYIRPRFFTNDLLKEYAPFFSGSVINVSGWDDRDSEGGFYKSYFINASSYAISNAAVSQKGFGSMEGNGILEHKIDLNEMLSKEYHKRFDIVFNHTTLEHIVHAEDAFRNLCALSRDAVILIVPAVQNIHISRSYGDYWRMTPLGVARHFIENGFEPLVVVCNDQPFAPIYCFAIGVRDLKKYRGKIEPHLDFEMGSYLYGSGLKKDAVRGLLSK